MVHRRRQLHIISGPEQFQLRNDPRGLFRRQVESMIDYVNDSRAEIT